MTVLLLLIVAVGQIVSGTTRVTTGNRQHLDADSQARLVFDRMTLDLGRMLKRQDVDYIFKDATTLPQVGNDSFFFYSEAPAYFDTSGAAAPGPSAQSSLALLGYRVNGMNQAPAFELARLSKGLTWDESGGATPGSIVYLSPSSTPSASATPAPSLASTLAGHWPTTIGTAANGYTDGVDVSYHVIADQVCRMEICFLLKPVAATATAAAQPAVYSINPYLGIPGHQSVNGLQDVRAIVVALGVLDRTSRQITPDLSHLATALPDITAANLSASPRVLMADLWQAEIDSGNLARDAQIPPAAAAQVRVYQRHFYLETN
jgi:hypothetical protein